MELTPIPAARWARWYEDELSEAFPPHERKPLSAIRDLCAGGRYELLGLYEGEALLGYAALWTHPGHPGCVLLDYLGVTAARRGGGTGSAILGLLGARFSGRRTVLAEAELPVPGGGEEENDLRRRRIGFYCRSGFAPVYRSAACGVALQTLALGPAEDLPALMAAHRAIYGPGRPDVLVPLEPGDTPEPPHWMKEG